MDTPLYTTKQELARAYAPHLSHNAAKHRLQKWMQTNPALMRALQRVGYNKYRQKLNPRELRIIYHFLGIP